MPRQVKQPSPETAFWQWFQDNAERLDREIEHDPEDVIGEVVEALARVRPGLTCEFGTQTDKEREFVISADGKRDLFPVVRRLVDAAPDLPGWKIIAFRQPKGTKFSVSFGTATLDPDDIWFALIPEGGGRVGLELYMAGLTPANREAFEYASILLLDAAIGEYAVETVIGSITCNPLPADPASRGLHSFHDLPRLVTGWTASA